MKNLILFILGSLLASVALAQENVAEPGKMRVSYYGFVRSDFYFDSRSCINGADGLFGIVPKDKAAIEGEDLNETSSARLLSIATRVGLKLGGLDVLGAKSSGRIEADFCGFSNSATMLRIRLAYMKLDWQKWGLLVGHNWHPMFGNVAPEVVGLSTGCPFQPFNFSPQVRLDYKLNRSSLFLAAIYQLQYNSVGPDAADNAKLSTSAQFLTDGILPELHLGWEGKSENFSFNAGVNYLRLKPRTAGFVDGQRVKVSECVSSFSATVAAAYKKDKLDVKLKSIYGQNLAHLLLFGGYGVTEKNEDGSFEYTNFNNSISWFNISYGLNHKVGLFLGYAKNLGTSDPLADYDNIYVRSGLKNLDYVWRGSLQYFYLKKHWALGLEYELTTAGYGKLDLNDGTVFGTEGVSNNRVTGMVQYFF